MKYVFLLSAAFILHTAAQAQNPMLQQRDSILKKIAYAKDDTNKVKLLTTVGKMYAEDKPDTALVYLNKAGALSEKLNYTEGTFHYLFALAPVLGEMDRLDECIAVSQKALALSKKVKNKTGIATAYFDIAGGYSAKGQMENALNYYLQTDTALRDINDTLRTCINYSKISRTYQVLAQEQKAYEYGMKAISLANASHSEQGLAGGLLCTADALGALNKDDSALILYAQVKQIYIKHNDDYDRISAMVNIDHILKKQGKYAQLLTDADTIIMLSQKIHRLEGVCEGLIQKSTYYFYNRQYAEANTYIQQALPIALKRDHPQTLDEVYTLMAEISLGMGNMQEYRHYSLLSDSVHEAIVSDKIIQNAQEMETKFSVADKEYRIKQQQAALHQRKIQITVLGIAVALTLATLVLGLLVYRNRRRLMLAEQALQQKKIEGLETERQLLATQSVVQGQEEERSRLAKELHDGLGGILSGAKYSLSNMKENLIITPENAAAFERTMNMLDLSITEMRRVAHNMMPESLMKLSLDEALQDYCEQVADSGAVAIDYQSTDIGTLALNNTQKITVYRVVQELINNILKHAGASSVIVQVFAKEKTLYVAVEDNGKGFDKSQLDFASGIGYRNIKSRIEYLNGKLDVRSEPGSGTSVYIEIPLQ